MFRRNDRPGKMVSQMSVNARMTEEEVDAMIANFAVADEYDKKTWTRRVVENFLSKFKWYFPSQELKNPPSLSKAYAYYEHITLPRHLVGEQTADHIQRRAEPGETQPTELYNPFTLSGSSFIEWGVGVDLYFSSLKIMAFTLFLAGLIHLPNIVFYGSSDYSPNGKPDLVFSLRGSAVCPVDAWNWVVCEDCTPTQWDSPEERERFITTTDGKTLVLRNSCDGGKLPQGLVNWFCLWFVMIVITLFSFYLRAREVRFDEDKVTSTDYSVVVRNPPPDAYDPDEWRDFFSQFAEKQVTVVTVAINNELMLRKLIARRYHRRNLRFMLPKGIDMEDEDVVRTAVSQLVQERDAEPKGCISKLIGCTVMPILHLFNWFLPAETLVDNVFRLTNEIKELQKEKYTVSAVFVTFETEEGQRAALSALSLGKLDIMMNNATNVAPSTLFRGQLLRVEEPTEPSAVRWLDLSASKRTRLFMRGLNLVLTLGLVVIAGIAVGYTRDKIGAALAGPLTSIFNTLIPLVVKILMIFEPHLTEGSFQASLYMKITLFRWINTALLTKLITPFTLTLADDSRDVLPQINAILWSELWLVPTLRLLDLWGNVKKHILAPRARTQEIMNLSFQGTYYNLGERYTDLTKIMFVCFFYSALYPSTFFFGAAILIVQYFADKYCLIRIWSWIPNIGSELARFSRIYFFSGAVVSYAIVSAYAWAQFPYDNVCDSESATSGNAGTYNGVNGNGETVPAITVLQDQSVVFCPQKWTGFVGFPFPPVSKKQPDGVQWMGNSQESLANLYGWTAVAVLAGYLAIFFGGAIKNFFLSWFRGTYYPSGQNQHIDFSANPDIYAYVPQIKKPGFAFPFLACNIDQIHQGLIGWNDPAHSYDHHNMIFDVPWEGMPRTKIIEGNTRNTTQIVDQEEYEANSDRFGAIVINETEKIEVSSRRTPIFSIIKHYPPAWTNKVIDTTDGEEYSPVQRIQSSRF